MEKYDICVIGAGSAGLVAARAANRLGARTVLLENRKMGGGYLHAGCIPSKTFIRSARLFYAMRQGSFRGLPDMLPGALNFRKVMEHVAGTVEGIARHEDKGVLEKKGISVFLGPTRFLSPYEIVCGQHSIRADHFLLCTGSSPAKPEIPGMKPGDYLTSENFWDLRELPASILMIGGGPVSLELGQALARFGSRVYVVFRSQRILKNDDSQLTAELQQILDREGITILPQLQYRKFIKTESGFRFYYRGSQGEGELDVEKVFAGIGRLANTAGLDLEKAGVRYSLKSVPVDSCLRTSRHHIYACGDITGPFRFTHMASYHAEVALDNILKNANRKVDYRYLPWVTFTDPEAAHVGLTEEQAALRYPGYKVLKVDCNLDRFITEGATGGFFKVILAANDGIIGAHALGARGGEYIQQMTLAMQHGLTIRDLAATIYPYPTFSEIVKKAFVRYLQTK